MANRIQTGHSIHIMQDHHSYIHQSLNRETLPYFLTNRSLLHTPFPFRHQTEHNPTPHPTSFFLQTRLKSRTHHSCQTRLFLSNQYTEYAYFSNTQWENLSRKSCYNGALEYSSDKTHQGLITVVKKVKESCSSTQYAECTTQTPQEGTYSKLSYKKALEYSSDKTEPKDSSKLSNQVKMSCSSNRHAECTIQTLHEGKYWTLIYQFAMYIHT